MKSGKQVFRISPFCVVKISDCLQILKDML